MKQKSKPNSTTVALAFDSGVYALCKNLLGKLEIVNIVKEERITRMDEPVTVFGAQVIDVRNWVPEDGRKVNLGGLRFQLG